MYILKNAVRSISRSKGRSLLIGIIVLALSVASCLGLSIRQAAEKARKNALEGLTVTAQISVDRTNIMQNLRPEQGAEDGSFDRESFKENMQNIKELEIDELQRYAELDSVADFYYTSTVSVNGSDTLEAVTTSSDSEDSNATAQTAPNAPDAMSGRGGKGGFMMGGMGAQGDFTLVGYSSDTAMTDFITGVSAVSDGEMFEQGTAEYNCVISDELAAFNDLSVGNAITVVNPNNEEETYTLNITGLYTNSQSTVSSGGNMRGFSAADDPANRIYTSSTVVNAICTASESAAVTETDEETGRTTTTAMPVQNSGTFVFSSVKDYEKFSEDVYNAGLSTDYTVSSSDVSVFEQSIVPLENLSEMALYFLIVVLSIGAVVLIVLNIFNVRERKYEVGVLTAIGMKKRKVSLQFILETLIITMTFLVVGGTVGAVTSVPVTNSLLKAQIQSQESQQSSQMQAFGRGEMPNIGNGASHGMPSGETGNADNGDRGFKGGFGGFMSGMMDRSTEYISTVNSAADLTVILQLLLIGAALSLIASAASIVFIMRYDPLKILANRD